MAPVDGYLNEKETSFSLVQIPPPEAAYIAAS